MNDWSQECPSSPGFYWIYAPAGTVLDTKDFFSVVEIDESGNLSEWNRFTMPEYERWFKTDCYWLGPLDQPSLPAPKGGL